MKSKYNISYLMNSKNILTTSSDFSSNVLEHLLITFHNKILKLK